MTLLEQYKGRLAVSESVYNRTHSGEKMDNHKKLVIAKILDNTSKFISEAFDAASGTQRSDLGLYKKFTLNLTTVALPNLIAHDLVIVHPMSSMSGFITYIEYSASRTKGQTTAGKFLNSPFALGDVDPDYTGDRVVENAAAGASLVLSWTPVVKEAFEDNGTKYDVKITHADGTVAFANVGADGKTVTPSAAFVATDRVAYFYDNIVVPQNDLPMLKAEMKNIALVAKARRIAVYYSQIAAFQAKTDYGFDLGDQLAEKAVGQLEYEIDTEVVQMLIDNAPTDETLTWSKTLPVGVSKAEHYQGFMEIVEDAKRIVYDRTKRFVPNYMICASDLIPVFSFIRDWNPAPVSDVNGPYFAGTLGSLKVFVSPALEAGKFIVGVNGSDMMSSAAVYAPYMAVVPTMLLQYADGGTSQGWSTMYDLKMLNANLLVSGGITA
jgi:hypothetical protein